MNTLTEALTNLGTIKSQKSCIPRLVKQSRETHAVMYDKIHEGAKQKKKNKKSIGNYRKQEKRSHVPPPSPNKMNPLSRLIAQRVSRTKCGIKSEHTKIYFNQAAPLQLHNNALTIDGNPHHPCDLTRDVLERHVLRVMCGPHAIP